MLLARYKVLHLRGAPEVIWFHQNESEISLKFK